VLDEEPAQDSPKPHRRTNHSRTKKARVAKSVESASEASISDGTDDDDDTDSSADQAPGGDGGSDGQLSDDFQKPHSKRKRSGVGVSPVANTDGVKRETSATADPDDPGTDDEIIPASVAKRKRPKTKGVTDTSTPAGSSSKGVIMPMHWIEVFSDEEDRWIRMLFI